LINPEKIEAWIREVDERPASSSNIIRFIANRLRDLAQRHEELLAEVIQLRSGQKVEEYEARIASLEYQLDLLRRQVSGDLLEAAPVDTLAETSSIFLYTPHGQVLRVELNRDLQEMRDAAQPSSAAFPVARFPAGLRSMRPDGGRGGQPGIPPRLVWTGSQEELLFLFDSGRTVTMPAAAIPACASPLDWQQAFIEEPHGAEELAAIVPVGRMSLADSVVQVSRRGFVKKMIRTAFVSFVAKRFIGPGIVQPKDRTCGVVLCGEDDRLVLVSKEGFSLTREVAGLSYRVEDMLQLSPTDHIVDGFGMGKKTWVVFVTQNGKLIHRDQDWLKAASSSRTRGQPVFSEERRKTGARLVGAAAVDETDACAFLDELGNLAVGSIKDLLESGSIQAGEERADLAAFTIRS
jgi:hypothetical protein